MASTRQRVPMVIEIQCEKVKTLLLHLKQKAVNMFYGLMLHSNWCIIPRVTPSTLFFNLSFNFNTVLIIHVRDSENSLMFF